MSTTISKLEQTAENPALLHATIADFTRQRIFLFCCAVLVTTCTLAMCLKFSSKQDAPTLAALGAVLLWMVVFRLDFQRRTLLLLAQCEKAKAEPPAAKLP